MAFFPDTKQPVNYGGNLNSYTRGDFDIHRNTSILQRHLSKLHQTTEYRYYTKYTTLLTLNRVIEIRRLAYIQLPNGNH